MAILKRVLDRVLLVGTNLYNRSLYSEFAEIGNDVYIGRGVEIEDPGSIVLGDQVHIGDFSWISIVPGAGATGQEKGDKRVRLLIGAGTRIGRFSTISCIDEIKIGKKVMFADRCFVADACHGFRQRDTAIMDHPMYSAGPVNIGDGSWIGINVSILPGVSIGKHCIIGANSVVTDDVPDCHIAVGVPARNMRAIEFSDEKTGQDVLGGQL